jgi:hypothetical protein
VLICKPLSKTRTRQSAALQLSTCMIKMSTSSQMFRALSLASPSHEPGDFHRREAEAAGAEVRGRGVLAAELGRMWISGRRNQGAGDPQ